MDASVGPVLMFGVIDPTRPAAKARAWTLPSSASYCGMLMVTASALVFGVVAAIVKSVEMPTLLKLQIRSVMEWLLCLAAAAYYRQLKKRVVRPPSPPPSPVSDDSVLIDFGDGDAPTPSEWTQLLFGARDLRGWLFLRSALYWGFMLFWWVALARMPLGDATTIVYVCPVFTAAFAWRFLGESVGAIFAVVFALDAAGVLLITQPSFASVATLTGHASTSYAVGVAASLASAVLAGAMPVCTRRSKAASWTAVNHVSAALSSFVFTPLAIAVWWATDADAPEQMKAGFEALRQSDQWLLLLAASVTGFIGLGLQTLGYQRVESASRAAVLSVLEIPFAYMLQGLLFHEGLEPLGIAGTALVTGASLLNLCVGRPRARTKKRECI